MTPAFDTVVIGSGVAGLTSAAYLSRSGLRTLLVEKEGRTGGLIQTFTYEGFAFDSGARAFENSGILFPMLKRLGIALEFRKRPVSIGIDGRWTQLTSKDSLGDYAEMLKEIFPENPADIDKIIAEISKVMDYLDILYGIDNPLFREDMKDKRYQRDTLLPWLLKFSRSLPKIARLKRPVNEHLRRFTKNEALIDVITQHFFKDTPASFALSYFSLYLDYSYPVGGTGSLTKALTEYCLEHGAEIRTRSAVRSMDTEKRLLHLTGGETISYKKLVWAANQETLYKLAKGPDSPKVRQMRELTAESRGADSIFTLFVGLDQDVDYVRSHSGAHVFYTPETKGLHTLPAWQTAAEEGEEALLTWLGSYLERTTYEIACPAAGDANLAPPGQSGLIISTLFDYDLTRHIADTGRYEFFKDYCRDKIIEVLSRQLYPEMEESLLFTLTSTPLSIEKLNASKDGSITGWAFTNRKMPSEQKLTKIRNAVRTPLPDVLQCGQWVMSPAGVPTCVLTGKLAADEVLKDLRG